MSGHAVHVSVFRLNLQFAAAEVVSPIILNIRHVFKCRTLFKADSPQNTVPLSSRGFLSEVHRVSGPWPVQSGIDGNVANYVNAQLAILINRRDVGLSPHVPSLAFLVVGATHIEHNFDTNIIVGRNKCFLNRGVSQSITLDFNIICTSFRKLYNSFNRHCTRLSQCRQKFLFSEHTQNVTCGGNHGFAAKGAVQLAKAHLSFSESYAKLAHERDAPGTNDPRRSCLGIFRWRCSALWRASAQ